MAQGYRANCLKATEPLLGDILLYTSSPHKFLVLTWLILKEWKIESNLKPPSHVELMTTGLGIQCHNL